MKNMREMLGEAGRTISNMDLQQLKSMLSPPPQGTRPSIPNISMSDNEPRFEDRSPENRMFTIDAAIENLLKQYDISVNDGDIQTAKVISNKVFDLNNQKINISQELDPQEDEISRILDSISI